MDLYLNKQISSEEIPIMKRVFENNEKTAFLDKGIFNNSILLAECISDIESLLEERPKLILFGKICQQQRFVGFFSNESSGYKYSGQKMFSNILSPSMEILLCKVNKIFGSEFNGILVNKYKDGNDYIGQHSDDESRLDTVGVIAISHGASRKFRIRTKTDKKIVYEENTTHCGIIHMGGDFQKIYTHDIPVQKKITEQRISFTFRKHIT
jgi:alkylated DNA repair dioxygenase AlkB